MYSAGMAVEAHESLECEEYCGQPQEVNSDQLRAVIEADPLHEIWPGAQCRPFYSHLAYEVNWKGEKAQ